MQFRKILSALTISSKALTISLALFIFCDSSFAFNIFNFKSGKFNNDFPSITDPKVKNNSPVLFFTSWRTKDGKPFDAYMEVKWFTGQSTSEPCSDITLWISIDHTLTIKPFEDKPTSSRDLMDFPGPGYTCFRTDIEIDGKTYSSGNITLQWDAANNVYTDANPKQIVTNFY